MACVTNEAGAQQLHTRNAPLRSLVQYVAIVVDALFLTLTQNWGDNSALVCCWASRKNACYRQSNVRSLAVFSQTLQIAELTSIFRVAHEITKCIVAARRTVGCVQVAVGDLERIGDSGTTEAHGQCKPSAVRGPFFSVR